MELAAIVMGGLATLLFIISFFLKDRSKVNEQEIEDVSMNLYQEMYQLKKRIKVLEEEMMVDSKFVPTKQKQTNQKNTAKKPVNEIIVNQVLSLHKQGIATDQIVTLSSLPKEEVQSIIKTRS